MKKRSKKAQQAYDIVLPLAKSMGYDLVDVEYGKEGQKMFLTVYIDKKGGITSDDCEAFSKEADPLIDEGMDSDADYFVVSSPGLTRPLEEVEDFRRYEGEKIDVKLFAVKDGIKDFIGKIEGTEGDEITFDVDGDKITLNIKEIAKAVRHIEF